jgi:hypothetical protein
MSTFKLTDSQIDTLEGILAAQSGFAVGLEILQDARNKALAEGIKGESVTIDRKFTKDVPHDSRTAALFTGEKLDSFWGLFPDFDAHKMRPTNKKELLHLSTGRGIGIVGSRSNVIAFHKAMTGLGMDCESGDTMLKSAAFSHFRDLMNRFRSGERIGVK